MRKTVAIVIAAAFVVALAGCSSDLPQTVDSCTPVASSGPAANAISAPGKFGQNPDAKIPTPTVTTRVQTATLRKGTGAVLGPNDIAEVQYTIYKGSNAQPMFSSGASAGFSKKSEFLATIGAKVTADPIGHFLTCQRVGSRSVTVLTAKQLFGSAATATQEGLTASDAMVMIMDVQSGFRGRATGALQPLTAGFPSVVTAPDGTPGVTFDLQTPPKTLRYETLRRGTGQVVKQSDTVILQVEGIQWTTNPLPTTTFTSTWKTHTPVVTPVESVSKSSTSTLDPGSSKALTGQTVGSQVLVVVPHKYGYPSGKAPQGYPTTGTLVFIYDILGVK